MIPVKFDRALVAGFLDAVQTGKPIEPPEGGWGAHAMLQLAGAMRFAVMTHGPERLNVVGLEVGFPVKDIRPNTQETADEFLGNLDTAINFMATLAQCVADGEYDQFCEPVVLAFVGQKDGDQILRKVSGFKD